MTENIPPKKNFGLRFLDAIAKIGQGKVRDALNETPETAVWVYLEAAGRKEMLGFSGRGWEVVSFMYKDELGTDYYLMRKLRTAVVVDPEA